MEMVHFIPSSQRRLAILAAQADTAPVLVSGASGTGKGAIAHWIHLNSPRATRPFIVTTRDTPILEQIPKAQGGTLFISEIGELPLGEQRILLNFINTHSITHPDGNHMRMLVNARVIATTDQALDQRAQGGLFNPELLEKLNVFRLEMPPLIERQDEFEDIVLAIIAEVTRELHKEHLKQPSSEAWEKLKSYDWPGNIREIRNVIRVAVISAQGDRIELSDLPAFGHDKVDFRATREQFERIYIVELLKTFSGDIDQTCRMTRMDKKALLAKISKYGINVSEMSIP